MNDNSGQNPLSQAKARPSTLSANPAEATHPAASPAATPAQTTGAAPAAPQKKKTGLIVGIIAGVLAIAGIAVAIVLVLNMNKGDAVVRALNKMMSSNAPEYVTVDGAITVDLDGQRSPVTGLDVKLKSDASTKSTINTANVDLTLKMKEGSDIALTVDEVYSTDGNLFFKVSGVREAIQSYLDMMSASSGTDASSYISMFDGIINSLEDKWLKISVDELKSMTSGVDGADRLTCLTDVTKDIRANNNAINDMFTKNPFISSTTENVTLASKGNTVYKVLFDKEKYENFSNELKDSDFVKKLMDCLGQENVTVGDNAKNIENLPDIFVEVDGNDNFTRLYLQTELKNNSSSTIDYDDTYDDDYDTEDSELDEEEVDVEDNDIDVEEEDIIDTSSKIGTMTFDLGFSYPTTINVAEPTDYDDFSNVMQSLTSSLYAPTYNTANLLD